MRRHLGLSRSGRRVQGYRLGQLRRRVRVWKNVLDPLGLLGDHPLLLLDTVGVDDGEALVGVCLRMTLGGRVRDHGGVVDADGVGRLVNLAGRVVSRQSDSVMLLLLLLTLMLLLLLLFLLMLLMLLMLFLLMLSLQVGDSLEGVGRSWGQPALEAIV